MRILLFSVSLIITIILIILLDTRKVLPAPLGKLLSPQEGLWQNAEPVDQDFNEDFRFPMLKGKVDVYMDERLVPHIFAENEEDASFVQGFLHAKFRLWQMEFQTHAAAGRVSEIVGDIAVKYDRTQRRMGMVYAAENALREMENDPAIRAVCDAYTAGINAYIETLTEATLPVEYKLLGYKPEKWNNLKIALFYKAMTKDLAGFDTDFEFTNAYKLLGEEKFRILYPELQDSLSPVIPNGNIIMASAPVPMPPPTADSTYFHHTDSIWFSEEFKPNPLNGSNNWAVSGSRTKSGKPILANDPHLGISLPSIWFEMQVNTPEYNSYGVSFPGIPGIIIGFNDNIAFGFTNSGRDVKDYYEITFRDRTKSQYWFNKEWKDSRLKIEHINVKGKPEVTDTVAYTIFGPAMYDESFQDKLKQNKAYALRWVGHDPSNAMRMWYDLNRAKDYDGYFNAIKHFNAPGQNMLFASKSGDIALWQQATFPLRWKYQGDFVMPGTDSSYMWKGFIPQQDNPHVLNPVQGFISSANQRPADSTYPYYIPGSYDLYRGIIINRRLSAMNNVTPDDMKALQNDNYNVFAETARPLFLKYVRRSKLNEDEKRYLQMLEQWNLQNNIEEKGPTVFNLLVDSLRKYVFSDDLERNGLPVEWPKRYTLIENILKDSLFSFIDNINTPSVETIEDAFTGSMKLASAEIKKLEISGKLEWGNYKNTTLYHILKTSMMPFARESLPIGGGVNIINATTHDHGPSWRMIVHLTTPTEAYAVYPGGQSGNPGSRFYDSFVDTWAAGKYYRLWIMQKNEKGDKRIKWKLTFSA
jgi:penicillin amidase